MESESSNIELESLHDGGASRAARRKLLALILILVLSSLGFCALVVWQRDTHLKSSALHWAETTRAWIQAYFDERGYLPVELADDLPKVSGAYEMPYPDREHVSRLRGMKGPYILMAGPRNGLITPGADGCAAILFDNGKIRVEWMARAEVKTAKADRQSWLNQ